MNTPRSKAYLQLGCPFSARLHIFLTEAGLANEVDIVAVEHQSELHRELLAEVEAAGHKPSFPFVQHSSGQFEVDSQAVIDRMAKERGIDSGSLPLLRFYNESMLPRFGKMFMELKRLKGADWNGAL